MSQNNKVVKGILPLKLKTGADRREMDRAISLLASLRYFWQGAEPFELTIVARDEECQSIREAITAEAALVKVIVRSEQEFFPTDSAFFELPGMYRQQVIKLYVPAKLKFGPYITFDADIICIRPVNERTFVSGEKLVSTWEPRHIHSWWRNGMSGFRLWTDLELPGLGVTPNVLHSDLAALVFKYLELRGLDPLKHLSDLCRKDRKLFEIEGEGMALGWSEYSLYTMVAEWFNQLDNHHLLEREVKATGIQVHSRRNVWSDKDVGRLMPDDADPGHFMVVQSWAGIGIEDIYDKLKLPFSPRAMLSSGTNH